MCDKPALNPAPFLFFDPLSWVNKANGANPQNPDPFCHG